MSVSSDRLSEIEKKLQSWETLRSELGDARVDRELSALRAERDALLAASGAAAAPASPAQVVYGDEVHGDGVQGDKIVAHLVQVIHNYASAHPGSDARQLQRQVAEYLDWMREIFGSVELRGIEQAGRQAVSLPLEQVYVPLQAEYLDEERPGLASESRAARRQPEQAAGQDARQEISLNQVLSLGRRVILTGGPGSGKTTVLQHIAWALAEALRTDRPGLAQGKLGLQPPLPLPVYVPLSQYAAYLRSLPPAARGQDKALATFISDYLLQRQTHLAFSPDFLAHLLREGRDLLLLLDGLDEVPDESGRGRVRQAIEDLAGGRQALRVVVTSRSAAYRGQAVLGRGFRQASVLALRREQIEALVRLAYHCIYPGSPAQAGGRAGDLLQGITRLEAERRRRLGESAPPLVDSPLMVRLLLIVHFNQRRLPDQRAELYRRAVDAMLSPEYALDQAVRDEIEQRMGGSLAANREMLQYLAFHMHQRGGQQGREIDEDALRQALAGEPGYAAFADDLIAETCQRGTLLEERGGSYRFIHLSFQEFLAGRHLVETVRDLERIAAFLESGPLLEDWWREPVLLALGYLDLTAPALARRLLLRLAGLDEAAGQRRLPLETRLAAAELAGTAYLECQSQAPDLGAGLQARLLALLHEPGRPYPSPLRRAAAADALDRLGWLPPDLYAFVRIDAAGLAQHGLRAGEGVELPFYLGKYLVTNAQYARFVQAADFADPQWWRGFPKFNERSRPMQGDWGEAGWEWLQEALQGEHAVDGRVYPDYWNDPRFGIARRGVPVVGLTWYEAGAYCRWLAQHWDELDEGPANPGLRPAQARLPLEAEWLLAAGGDLPKERFPWDAPGAVTQEKELEEILRRANVERKIGRTTPVGTYPLGASWPFGLWDLGGNAWEWQANFSDKDHDTPALRGGAWLNYWYRARPSARAVVHPVNPWRYVGFRVWARPSHVLVP